VEISTWQHQRLETIRDHPPSMSVCRRAVCLLLSAAGETGAAIARATGLSIDAMTDIRRRWQLRGMASLQDPKSPGRPARVTASYRHQLHQALRTGPLELGYGFSVWTVGRLNTYLQEITGLRFCNEWVRRLIHREHWVYRRPKHTLRGRRNENAFRQARKRLDRLKKGL
jgi:transposase